ncbi:hypothetical protein [Croceicoccus sp. Ery15]|uniref:hypothetical protein n=1 Tax=Croceicoccus sp. Ery15 TaxID=1703338 RepID=UPI001E2D3034|nr:hypothetical protein [Croceicoccus sp. Ery15]|tara:strand:+ start:646 stop:1047 length:402 start_codon:yes stop_codon:yes gene_type:complete
MELDKTLDTLGNLLESIIEARVAEGVATPKDFERVLGALKVMLWSLTRSPDEIDTVDRPVAELSVLLADARVEAPQCYIHSTDSQEIVQNLASRGYLEAPSEMQGWKDPMHRDTAKIILALAAPVIGVMCKHR